MSPASASENVVIILGPTGTGKSLVALELALKLKTAIVNADSIQVYRELVIGSAQPSKEDFKIAPHHLYGYLASGTSLTAAAYCKDVETLLTNKLANTTPLFCGGSGFYIQALEKGMFAVPTLTDAQKQRVDDKINEWGWEKAYQELLKQDPSVAPKIHENDHYRIRRAWEIILTTNKNPSEIATQSDTAPLRNKKIIKIGLDLEKEKLRERIKIRTQKMLQAGWLEEVETLLKAGHREWSPLKSVGYQEVVEHLDGLLSKNEMIEKIITSNMQLIKKQRTWFKRDPDICWFSSDSTKPAVDRVLSTLS